MWIENNNFWNNENQLSKLKFKEDDAKLSNEILQNPSFLEEKWEIIDQTKSDLQNLKLELKNIESFLKNNEKYRENPDYYPVIDYCLKNNFNTDQTILVLEAQWKIIEERSDSKEMFDIVKTLKDEGLLDSAWIEFNLDEWENESDLQLDNSSESSEKNDSITEKIINMAKSQVWIREWREANKYWVNTIKTPWCAAFVNWVLAQSWLPGSGSNLSLSFVGLSGYWHAWIKDWNKMLSWNRWNKVAHSAPMSKMAVWYAIPTPNWLKKYPWNIAYDKIPNWAIVCWRRNPKSGRWA